MKLSGSSESVRGPVGNVVVATGPQKDVPELSDSLLNDPRWVNDPFRTAPRKQPFDFSPKRIYPGQDFIPGHTRGAPS